MIPADDADLPVGSEAQIVRMVRKAADDSPKQGGIVSLIESGHDGRTHVIANRPWAGSPMFVVLEYFGLAFTSETYHRVLRSVREDKDRRNDLFIRLEEDQPQEEPIKAAIVQTVDGWGLAEAEQFLTSHKH